jgi:hypothetical protein
MSLVLRHALPRSIERGVANTLTADVYDAAGSQQTASAGTLTLYAGSKLILDGVAVTSAGSPTSHTLAAGSTTGEGLSDSWLEVWSLTIGGTVYTFRRDAYLVRHVLYPSITDTDLIGLHSDLAALRDSDQSSYQTQREAAWTRVQRRLIKAGRRPELVLNSWALAEYHLLLTLQIIFADFALSTGDARYSQMSAEYRDAAKAEFDELPLRYDADEGGTEDDGDRAAAEPVTFLSQPWGY